MSGGLLALLDDVVAIAKLAAVSLDDAATQAVQASAKAAGVVIDDAAVTPRYVVGLAANRELSIVWRIAKGSLFNKIVLLLPVALLLTVFAPSAVTPLLMIGGLFLAFEGYEKVHEMAGADHARSDNSAAGLKPVDPRALEDQRVAGAIRTDLILSAEIMAIALAGLEEPSLLDQALTLSIVALVVTAGVYGAVALIVKADDLGVHLAKRDGALSGPFGRGLVRTMPPFLKALSFVGMLAMLWVGGGIIVHGLAELGVPLPEHLVHEISTAVETALPLFGGLAAWLASAASTAVVGLAVGALTALLVHQFLVPVLRLFGRSA